MSTNITVRVPSNAITVRQGGPQGPPGKDVLSNLPFTATGGSSISLTDDDAVVSSTGGTVNLPTASGRKGRQFTAKSVPGSGSFRMETNGSETIDGDDGIDIPDSASVTVISDGTNWLIL